MIRLKSNGLRCAWLAGLAALGVGAASAARLCETGPIDFPSVEADGNLNTIDDLGVGDGKLCVNTRNEKFVFKGSGETTNASGQGQTYKNDAVVSEFYGPILDGLDDTNKLKIGKSGKAKVLAKGTIPPDA